MISNFPVSTVTRKSAIAQNMIHDIGKMPNAPPYAAALMAILAGMPYPAIASTNATASPAMPASQAAFRNTPRRKSKVKIGKAAMSAEMPNPCENKEYV
jgi:hypothetical protein